MNHPIAEIFSQGEEVITGQVVDTNAAWLSEKLVQMGFVVSRHTVVGDKLQDLVDLLQEISSRADFCICTGGLGPTLDDLTAEAVALAFSTPLQMDSVALDNIACYFSNRNRTMVDTNKKQAMLPAGSIRLDNLSGTAPGFALQNKRCWFVFVPGVPSEMKQMFNIEIKPKLEQQFTLQTDRLIIIKTIGIGESELQEKLNDFSLPQNVQLSFRATPSEVQTKLLFPANITETTLKNCVNQLLKTLGDVVFAVDELNKSNTELVDVVDQLMKEKKQTLAVIETLSQGLIAAKCVGKDWLLASYFEQIPHIDKQGDISEIAAAMAKKLRKSQNSDLILLQLPLGNTRHFHDKEKSIVLYNILIGSHQIAQKSITVVGSITRKQNQAAIKALDFLRKTLQTNAFNTTQ